MDSELLDAEEGRHAIDEDALVTPIFAAVRRGIRRRSNHAEFSRAGGAAGTWSRDGGGLGERSPRESLRDPVDEFHRDPLTAPIPVQVLVPAPSRSHERMNTASHRYREERGRHHRESVAS